MTNRFRFPLPHLAMFGGLTLAALSACAGPEDVTKHRAAMRLPPKMQQPASRPAASTPRPKPTEQK